MQPALGHNSVHKQMTAFEVFTGTISGHKSKGTSCRKYCCKRNVSFRAMPLKIEDLGLHSEY